MKKIKETVHITCGHQTRCGLMVSQETQSKEQASWPCSDSDYTAFGSSPAQHSATTVQTQGLSWPEAHILEA